eukprot:CAMPEP_0175076718 /NCGR_PEP_ID=MMETSP0052_2-20121109/22902_1 /TAXON_ID=51329 ORGANISM="Polytomella parva, Strain SAG 63-3" /NCGR_SAMPLE_ID=MMETSP0052_2 /ASSEMBLY_ACC=CAM_ASM_000194 /LENGTH=154 /DNA_ID=CAMNT_0016345927 /DNA_START=141 /DNA_END=605 /DNA_ORIENTATION=-
MSALKGDNPIYPNSDKILGSSPSSGNHAPNNVSAGNGPSSFLSNLLPSETAAKLHEKFINLTSYPDSFFGLGGDGKNPKKSRVSYEGNRRDMGTNKPFDDKNPWKSSVPGLVPKVDLSSLYNKPEVLNKNNSTNCNSNSARQLVNSDRPDPNIT